MNYISIEPGRFDRVKLEFLTGDKEFKGRSCDFKVRDFHDFSRIMILVGEPSAEERNQPIGDFYGEK